MSIERLAYTVPEAAEAAQISRAKLYQVIESGELPSLKIGRSRRILREDLVAFLRAHRTDGGDAVACAIYVLADLRGASLSSWLSKGGSRRREIRERVQIRAAGECEACGGELDMHDGRSQFGGTYVLVDTAAPITAENVRLVHRGCGA